MSHPKILIVPGSLRTGSYNKKLARVALNEATAAGAEASVIDLRDFPLPVFDEDIESQGAPKQVSELKKIFKSNDGILFCCPEYNSSITAALKNTIDWLSRPVPNEPSLVAFKGKVAGLLSASTGALGGLRGLVHVRSILGNIGVLVVPEQYSLANADQAFTEDGALKDAKLVGRVRTVVTSVIAVTTKLHLR